VPSQNRPLSKAIRPVRCQTSLDTTGAPLVLPHHIAIGAFLQSTTVQCSSGVLSSVPPDISSAPS
jgi:hypothetical protein